MRRERRHIKTVVAFLLLPLFVFLLLSCPVKRSLLSSFLPGYVAASASAEWHEAEWHEAETASPLSTAVPCVSGKLHALEKEAGPVIISVVSHPDPVAVVSGTPLWLNRYLASSFPVFLSNSRFPHCETDLFLWHQSFLI